MQKIMVIGHIGKDAIVKEVGGKKVINFSVAHTENYTNGQGEKVSKTTWHECAKWGENANVAPYLLKGTQVYVEGTATAEAYADKEGKAQASLKVTVFNLQLLGTATAKPEAAPAAQAAAAPPPPPPQPVWNGTAWVIPTAPAPAAVATGAPVDDNLPF